jgi:flagellar hook protein FlgE
MSIFGAMFSGVTGLNAQSQALGMIADNISNVNTIGYKGVKASFSTLVTQAASQSTFTPGGVKSVPTQTIDRQGLLQSSASKSDIAIAGNGFFLVNEAATVAQGNEYLFTRAGSFSPDKNGNLVNTGGYYLQGWPLTNGALPTNTSVLTSVQTINVSNFAGTATATTSASIALNLPSTAPNSGNGEINSTISTPLAGVANLDLMSFGTLDQVAKLTYNSGTQQITVTVGGSTGVFDVSAQAAQTYVSTGTLAGMEITLNGSFNFASAITTAANTDNVTSGTLALAGAVPVLSNFDANDLAALSTTAMAFSVSTAGVVTMTSGPTGFSVAASSQTVAATGNRVITITDGTNSFDVTLDVTTANGGATAVFDINLLELQNSIGVGAPVTGATFSSAVQIFDSLGNAHDLVIQYTKVDTNTWSIDISDPVLASSGVTSGTVAAATRNIVFNGDGTPATITFPPVAISAWTTGAVNSTVTMNMGTANQTNGVTQFAGQFSLTSVDQDGARYGGFVGVNIGDDGIVTALFDNGEQLQVYQLPIVMFANPNGLEARNGNAYGQTDRSGDIILQRANAGGAGVVASSALESSNVDLAEEFTKMITTQRAYSASAKIITTADDMLEELIRIRR